jgi:trimethylamine--corrinoid protein Co-methyltransferase
MPTATLTLWGEEELRRLHEATLTLLDDVGVEVLNHEPSLTAFRELGARIDGSRVYLDAQLVESALNAAPSSWMLRPRGGETAQLELRNGQVYFGTGSDCLYTRDLHTLERRRTRLADIEAMAALGERLGNIDFVMSMGVPEDVPREIDDLAQFVGMLRGTRKPLIMAPRDGSVLADMQAMADLCGEKDSFLIYAMPSPPLQHDADALTKVIGCAEMQIPLVYASAPNAGTTSPRSITATVLVNNAEVLSGLVLHQHVRPGAPFIYGAGGGAMDMRAMTADPYSIPEACLALQACCELARHYDLPSFSYAADSESKLLDEQWSAEAALTCLAGALSRATLLHDVGYLECGMQSSFESIVLGDVLAGWSRAFMREVPVDDYSLALDEIAAAGPGGNHLASRYTRRHHREFWADDLFDHASFDGWVSAGEHTLKDRAHERALRLHNEERAFMLNADLNARLDEMLKEALARSDERL